MVSSGDVQRLFLQGVLSRGMLSEKLARIIWQKSVEAVKAADDTLDIHYSDTEDAWDNFVQSINTSLNDLDFEFKGVQDETNGKKMFAFVNLKDDELAQVATSYSAVEITYFKAVVEQIMLARYESFSVSSLVALREVSAGKEKMNLTKAQAQNLLGSFVASGWLLKSKRGRYSLSPRSLLELLPYLKSTYQDEMLECTICHEVVTKGIACKRANCKTRMHFHCFKVYRRRKGTCPACTMDWPQEPSDEALVPVGEAAIRDGEDRRRTRATNDEDDADEDDEEMEDEPSQTQKKPTQRRSQSQKGKKGKGKKVESEEEAEEEEEEEQEAENTPPPRRRNTRR